MRIQINHIIFGIINQPQIRMKNGGEGSTTMLNTIVLGAVNQPQVRIQHKGENMDTEITPTNEEDGKGIQVRMQGGSSGMVYGLGVIGACIFYINRGTTTQEKAMGFLKALVWPVFLVKEALEFLEKD